MLTIKWDPEVEQLMANNAGKMPVVIHDLLQRLGVIGTSYMKRITPVDKGELRKRISFIISSKPEVYIGTNVAYAPYILPDTPPFIIRAKNKKALAWVDKGHIRPSTSAGWKMARKLGIAHYAKEVKHPGGINAFGKTEDHLNGLISDVMMSVLKKHGIAGE